MVRKGPAKLSIAKPVKPPAKKEINWIDADQYQPRCITCNAPAGVITIEGNPMCTMCYIELRRNADDMHKRGEAYDKQLARLTKEIGAIIERRKQDARSR